MSSKNSKVDDTVKIIKHETETVSCKQSNADSDSNSDPESTESESESSLSESSDDNVSVATTDILSNDPLYFVLSKLFMTEDNINLATILQQINQKLDILVKKSKK